MNAAIVFFSGTGGTQLAADCFESQLTQRGARVTKIRIGRQTPPVPADTDLLLVLAPVYAFRLASIAEEYLKRLPRVRGTKAALISVSGGGEKPPNTACRVKGKRLLARRGWRVVYESMLVMPSNFGVATDPAVCSALIGVLPEKAKAAVEEILAGRERLTRPRTADRLLAALCRAEHFGARVFGAGLRAGGACNGCGLCVRNCPRGNIRPHGKSVRFGFRCIWCLKCVYACPCRAISPGFLKSVVLENGYDIETMRRAAGKDGSGAALPPGTGWVGVREYLEH